jgi:hypothetical protein
MAVDIKLQRAKQRSRRLKGLSYVGPDDTKVVDVGVTQIETHPVLFQPHEFLGKGDIEHHIAPGQNPLNKKGKGHNGGGMPDFKPTAEHREILYKASGFGLPQRDICCLVNASPRPRRSASDIVNHRRRRLAVLRCDVVAVNSVVLERVDDGAVRIHDADSARNAERIWHRLACPCAPTR